MSVSGGLERIVEGVMYAYLPSIGLCIRQEMHALKLRAAKPPSLLCVLTLRSLCFFVTYVTRGRHSNLGGLATIDENAILSSVVQSVRLTFREEMLKLRLAAIKAPASRMSNFTFDDVAFEPTISTYDVPMTDDERIAGIVDLIIKFRSNPM